MGKFRESDLEKGIKPDLLLQNVNELPKALMKML